MDCYKVLSPSLEALFAVGSLRPFRLRLRSDSDPAPVQQLATYNAGQIFLRFSLHIIPNVLTPQKQ